MTAITPTDRPKSVCNRCVIEVLGGVFYVVLLFFGFFCGCRGFCHRTESDLFLFIRPSSDGTYYGMVMSVRHSFPHFSPTCFEILSWNFVYQFIMMHVRASSNAINFCQFLMELCPFLTSNCYKYAVFHTFLLHALTFWAEILHMTLFYCTTEQVWVSSISVNFCRSYAPFGT